MKDNNLLLEENKYVDENELATSEEWKLQYKNLRLDIYYVRWYFAWNILEWLLRYFAEKWAFL